MQDRPSVPPQSASSGQSTSFAVRLFRPLAYLWLWGSGFRVEGAMPDLPKFLIVAAPHTTNWDLPYTLAAGLHYGLRVHWLGKTSIFRWPFGGVMRWLGGVAIERGKSTNAVTGAVGLFTAAASAAPFR